jgi:hypothetical protein
VQDARRRELAELAQLEPERARLQPELPGDRDEARERGPLERGGEAAAQLAQVGALPVVGRDHRQAGEAALG